MSDEKRADALEKASIDASVEGLKALLILNGGACISLLAFLSSTMGKEQMSRIESQFVAGARGALVFFSIGAGLAVLTCLFAYLANQSYSSHLRWREEYRRHWSYGKAWNKAGVATTLLSIGLFFYGIYTVWSHAG